MKNNDAGAHRPGTAGVNRIRRSLTAAAGLSLASLAGSRPARSQSNGRLLKIVVPYDPGGSADIIGRGVVQRYSQRTGKSAIIDNRGGAGGSIGAEIVVRADPDGNTLLLHTGTLAVEYAAHKKVPYDVRKDLSPVTMIAAGPFALIVTPSLKARSIKELIALAKANPGKLNYGSAGIGTSVHMAMELFKAMAGVDIVHVPFKGAAPAYTAILSGQIEMMIDPLITAKPADAAGQVRALAVSTGKRTALWPNLPTLDEAGVPGYDTSVWYGLSAPSATPAATVATLAADFQAIARTDDARVWLNRGGLEPVGDTPTDFRARLDREIQLWSKLIQQTGMKLY
jgi:tripartite-type tricarboxylate transporter receptor subunit TctC